MGVLPGVNDAFAPDFRPSRSGAPAGAVRHGDEETPGDPTMIGYISIAGGRRPAAAAAPVQKD